MFKTRIEFKTVFYPNFKGSKKPKAIVNHEELKFRNKKGFKLT